MTDNLPTGLVIASTPAATTTCTSGVATASAGGSTLSLSGATIAAGANCNFSASVVSNTPGSYPNNIPIGSIVTNEGLSNPGAANHTLTVYNPPTVSKSFNPVSISAGGMSTLTITLGNANTTSTTLSAAFVDALPGSVVVATPNGLSKTCAGGVTAVAGSNSITYASGAAIPIGSCTISVNVTSSTAGTYTNTIAAGQLSTGVGLNQDPAVATLAVGPGALAPPTMTKSFNQGTIFTNGTSALTLSLGNPNSGALTLTALFTDVLPTNVLVAATPNIRGTCAGTVTTAAGAGTITYANGATIPSGGCTIIVDVTSGTAGSYTNTLATTALITDGGSPALPTTAGLVVNTLTPPTVLKSFNPGTINPGSTSRLTLSLGNGNGGAMGLTSDFTDNLPGGVTVATPPNIGGTCTIGSVTTGAGSITYASGAQIPSGGCTIQVDVTAASNVGSPFTNTISAGALQTSAGNNGAPGTAKLFVNPPQPPSISKSFSPASILAGGTSTLTIFLGNGNAAGTTLTANLVDTLPSNVVIATNPNIRIGGGCTLGKVVASAGRNTVTYQTGGAIPGGGCSIAVDVTSSITNAGYVNTLAVGALQTGIGNNTAGTSATLTVVAPDLTTTKTHSGNFTQGQTGAQYVLTVRNSGNGDKTAGNTVTVTESAPSGLTVTGMNGTGWTCAALPTCTRTDGLAAGGSYPVITVTVDVANNAAASLTNSASASLSGQPESNTNNNTATDPTTITQLPDLTITKTDGQASAVPGQGVTYTIVVSNTGPSNVAGATVSDIMPAILTGVTWTCVAGGGAACTASGTGNIGDTVNIPVDGTATYTVMGTVSASATGNLVNTATVSAPAGVTDPTPGNNSAMDTDTLTPSADLSITKTADKMNPAVNDTVVFTLSVKNNGPSDATGVKVTDILVSSLEYVSDTSTGAYNDTTGLWDIGTLTVGSTVTMQITVTVKEAGRIINIASITASDVPDPDRSNNSSGLMLNTGLSEADLGVDKVVSNATPNVSDNIIYTITVTNNGPDNATGVQLTDKLPGGLSYVSNDAGASYYSGTGLWSIGNLNVGDRATLHITAQVTASGEIINTAAITASDQTDPDITNNQSSDIINPATLMADLAVQKTVNLDTVNLNDTVIFTAIVRNNGPDDAHNVKIRDVADAGLTNITTKGCAEDPNGVSPCSVGTIKAGSYALIEITAQVTVAGSQTNTASVLSLDETDPNPNNDSDDATVTVAVSPAISVVKASTTPAITTAGQIVPYTFTVTNTGNVTLSGITVTDAKCDAAPAYQSGDSNSDGLLQLSETWVYTCSHTVTQAEVDAGGNLSNTVTTDSTESGPATSTKNIPVNLSADLSITKTDGQASAVPGQGVTYTIVVSNTGPSNVAGATVSDIMPAILTGVTWTCVAGGGASCTVNGTGNISDTVNILVGGTATYTVTGAVSASATGNLVNTATVSVPAGVTDPTPGNNSATDTDTLTSQPDLTITKSHSGNFTQGQTGAQYTITVSNSGLGSTSGTVTVVDTLPSGLTATAISGTGWNCALGTLTCTTERCAGGKFQLPGDYGDGGCGEQRACERDQHGDGIRRRRNQHRK